MEIWISGILAFLIAALVVTLELITSKYPQTFFVLSKERALYFYAVIYGGIALVVMLAFNGLIEAKTVTLEGLGLSSPYIRAIVVGVSIKALLHINLFTVTAGSRSTPIGLETIVQLFEPSLLRTILLSEFNGLRLYIKPYAQKYPDLTTNKVTVKDNIPPSLSREEIAAFEKDIENANDVTELLELVVRNLGRRTLNRLFPPNQ